MLQGSKPAIELQKNQGMGMALKALQPAYTKTQDNSQSAACESSNTTLVTLARATSQAPLVNLCLGELH